MKQQVNISRPQTLLNHSDAYYAGENDLKKSGTGHVVLVNKLYIAWIFQSQKNISMLVT